MGGDGCRTKQTRQRRRRRRPDIKAALLQIKEATSTVNCCHRWKPSMSQPGTAAGQPFDHQSVCKCTDVDGHRRCRCHRTEDLRYTYEIYLRNVLTPIFSWCIREQHYSTSGQSNSTKKAASPPHMDGSVEFACYNDNCLHL